LTAVQRDTHYNPYDCLVGVADRMCCMLNAWWREGGHTVNTLAGVLMALPFAGHSSYVKALLGGFGRQVHNLHELYSEEYPKLSSLRT